MTVQLAQRLRAARAALFPSVTQRDVAKRLGRSPSAVNLWEAGKTEPGVTELVELAKWYAVSTDWLLGMTPDNQVVKATDVTSPSVNLVPVVTAASMGRWRWDVVTELLQTQIAYPDGTAAALLVQSDALSSTCPSGAYVVASKAHTVEPGHIVLATTGRGAEPVLRKFVREGIDGLLIADDTRYPTYRVEDGVTIIARVVEVCIRRALT